MMGNEMRVAWWANLCLPAESGGSPNDWVDPEFYSARARMLEQAGVNLLLLAEVQGPTLSPAVLASTLQDATSTMGIVPVLNSASYPPFISARLLTTLDHMSRGRAGWALDELLKADAGERDRVGEYIEVLRKLWASWEPGVMTNDWENGVWADPSKVHPINHEGKYYKVKGPLNTPPSPQGKPIMVQPLGDEGDLNLVARFADVVIVTGYTAAELSAVRERVRGAAVANGRDADSILVYFALSIQIAETEDVARQKSELIPNGAWPSNKVDVLHLVGTAEDVAAKLAETYDASHADGCVIIGDWDWRQVNGVGNQVLGNLRRSGRLAPTVRGDELLQERIGLGGDR
jgi:alkanesulfonate monooxygenase SsuD/methylene tetrahydromethanopterin reductase-like flavin-dependent oxidoreductase (luciferase family)